MTLKDGYRFGSFSGTPPSEPNLSTPNPPGKLAAKVSNPFPNKGYGSIPDIGVDLFSRMGGGGG